MGKAKEMKIVSVDRFNIEETGFFCYMSKRKSEGYLRKLAWVKARLDEGMRIKMLQLPERGFIEYIPGEFAWRAARSEGYMFIHCLWVVGRSKGKGLGGHLIDECVKDAKKAGMFGAAMVTSEGNWLAAKKLFESRGFKVADTAPPAFALMVKTLKPGRLPSFPDDWVARAARFGPGLTILRTSQCPYLPDATRILFEAASKRKMKTRVIELQTARDVQALSPSPYGVFNIVCDGRLLGYHYLTEENFLAALQRRS